MKLLVTGVRGQLGYDVCRVLSAHGLENRGIDLEELDITDEAAVRAYVSDYCPDAIIHCAAFTAVDAAEDQPALCERVNADGPRFLARAVREIGGKMMQISTDYVFDGQKDGFYQPNDRVNPLSVYGKTKQMGEAAVMGILDRFFILRTSWVFGTHGKNFVKTMLSLADKKSDLNIVCDQIGSPTYTHDLAILIADMIVTDRYGIYHATNEGVCSWAEFAEEIMRQGSKSTVIHPIPSSQYPTRAKRPQNSRMSKDKLVQNGFSRLPHWRDALSRYLAEERKPEKQGERL